MEQEDIMFMINTSEHVKRPQDMLMFIGEYFKTHIQSCAKILNAASNKDNKEPAKLHLDSWYITNEILNSLGTACKLFIENPRQELRISIALSRKPVFYTEEGDETEQLAKIRENIVKTQLHIIEHCTKLYKFIDYFQDARNEKPVKLKSHFYQPPKCILNATLYKMKADYLRYIAECLFGDDGLLCKRNFPTLFNFRETFNDDKIEKIANEITVEMVVDCEICFDAHAKFQESE